MSLGSILREARERKGLTIAQVAEQILPGVKTKTGATIQEIKAILDKLGYPYIEK